MNLQENISRIKEVMGLITEGLHDTSWENVDEISNELDEYSRTLKNARKQGSGLRFPKTAIKYNPLRFRPYSREKLDIQKEEQTEGLHDTSWENDEGDKITLMDFRKTFNAKPKPKPIPVWEQMLPVMGDVSLPNRVRPIYVLRDFLF